MLAKLFAESVSKGKSTFVSRIAPSLRNNDTGKAFFSQSSHVNDAWNPPISADTPPEIYNQFTVFQPKNSIIAPKYLKELCSITGKAPLEHFAPSPERLAWQQTIMAALRYQCETPHEFHDNTHKLWHHLQPVMSEVQSVMLKYFRKQQERATELLGKEMSAYQGMQGQNAAFLRGRRDNGEERLQDPEYFSKVAETMTALDFYNASCREIVDSIISEPLQHGAKKEGIRPVPAMDKDNHVIFIHGAPGTGKSVAWPYFRNVFEKYYDLPWSNFQKVNSDWWRPLLCDRESLSPEAQIYYERLTTDELTALTLACYNQLFNEGKPNPNIIIEHPFPSSLMLNNAMHANTESYPEDTTIKMVFFIVPPEEVIERVNSRAEKGNPSTKMGAGRFAPVHETLNRYKSALSGDRDDCFLRVLNLGRSPNANVEIKILDKDIPLGEAPKLVLKSDLKTGFTRIYDMRTLLLMAKYSHINTKAASPDELYNHSDLDLQSHVDFLDHFSHISEKIECVDRGSGMVYATFENDTFTVHNDDVLQQQLRDPYHAFALNWLSGGKIATHAVNQLTNEAPPNRTI